VFECSFCFSFVEFIHFQFTFQQALNLADKEIYNIVLTMAAKFLAQAAFAIDSTFARAFIKSYGKVSADAASQFGKKMH
jgi:hypothetical protein